MHLKIRVLQLQMWNFPTLLRVKNCPMQLHLALRNHQFAPRPRHPILHLLYVLNLLVQLQSVKCPVQHQCPSLLIVLHLCLPKQVLSKMTQETA